MLNEVSSRAAPNSGSGSSTAGVSTPSSDSSGFAGSPSAVANMEKYTESGPAKTQFEYSPTQNL